MQILPTIAAIGATLTAVFFIFRYSFRQVIKRKAIPQLDAILFPDGLSQKAIITNKLKELTHDRFSEEQTLDYFMKIKGLQVVTLSQRSNFWIRKYLFSPTTIKLNYFEQVNFYKLFLNYPSTAETPTPAKEPWSAALSWPQNQFQYKTGLLDQSMA